MAVATTTALAIGGLALAAAGTAVSVQQGMAARKDAKKAAAAEKKAAALEAQKQRRRAIREERQKRGALLAAGAATGASIEGGLSGLSSQRDAGLGFSTQTQALGNRITQLNTSAARHRTIGGIASQVGGIGQSIFSNRAGIAKAFG